jgi:type I restriction enzyme S subunit
MVPPTNLQSMWLERTLPLTTDCQVLLAQNQRLLSLHSSLLPKLVTGEIDVSHLDLDALLEQTAA